MSTYLRISDFAPVYTDLESFMNASSEEFYNEVMRGAARPFCDECYEQLVSLIQGKTFIGNR